MIAESLLMASLLCVPEPPLSWFGEDKIKHFVASFVVSSLAASSARAAGLRRSDSLLLGAGVGVSVGLAKELDDVRRGGGFSGYDLVWDLAGVGAAIAVLDAAR